MEAVASRVEAIALGLEAIASRVEAIALWLETIASRVEAIALRLEAIAFFFRLVKTFPTCQHCLECLQMGQSLGCMHFGPFKSQERSKQLDCRLTMKNRSGLSWIYIIR